MKVIVVGGGKIGFYLTRTLLEHGHEPVLIERILMSACGSPTVLICR